MSSSWVNPCPHPLLTALFSAFFLEQTRPTDVSQTHNSALPDPPKQTLPSRTQEGTRGTTQNMTLSDDNDKTK